MKRITAALLVFCLLVTLLPIAVFATDSSVVPNAFLSFDGTQSVNITDFKPVEGVLAYEEKGDTQLLKLRRADGGANYLAVDVKDGVFSNEKGGYIFVTVQYYDEGLGYGVIRYNTEGTSDYSYTETLRMTNSKQFKEYTFVLKDCVFKNGVSGGDILMGIWSPNASTVSTSPFYVKSVSIEEGYPLDVIDIGLNSKHTGNIFDSDDKKELWLLAENKLNVPMDIEINYEITDREGNFIEEGGKWNKSLEATEKAEDEHFTVGVERFGLYEVKITYTCTFEWGGKMRSVNNERLLDFSIMNKLTEEEEPNRLIRTNAHEGMAWADADTVAQMYVDAGISGVRDEYRWGLLEQTKGQFNVIYRANGQVTKDFPAINTNRGMDQLLILDYGNGLYMPGEATDAKVIPDNKRYPGSEEAFLNYVDWITKHYGNSVKYYEFWNEPDHPPFNKYRDTANNRGDAQMYVNLLKKVYPIVKKNAPKSLVVGGAVTTGGAYFMDYILEAGGGEYMDAVSCHSYIMDGTYTGDEWKTTINKIHAAKKKYGCEDLPLLVTETGVAAYPEGGKWPTDFVAGMQIVQMIALAQAEELAQELYLFQYINNFPNIAWADGTQEQRWGFVNHRNEAVPYSARPAALALSAYNKLVGNAKIENKYVSEPDADGHRTYLYQFKREKDGKDVLVYWTEYGSETVGVKLGCDTAQSFDSYSNSEGALSATNDVFTLTTSFEPRYLVGDFSDFLLTAPAITTTGGRIPAVKNDVVSLEYTDNKNRDLNAVVSADPNLNVTENRGIVKGKGKVVLSTGMDSPENGSPVTVKLYDSEGNMVYDALYHILESDTLVGFSGIIEKYSEKVKDRYVLKLTVSNLSSGIPISGNVSVDFTEENGSLQTRKIKDLSGNSDIMLRFNPPFANGQKIRNLTVNYDLDGIGTGSSEILVFPALTATYAKTPPSIKGDYNVTEWTGSGWFSANDAYAAQRYVDWKGASDAGFEGAMMWDAENLYFLAEITDDVHYQPYKGADSWKGDSIQLGIMNEENVTVLLSNMTGTATFTEVAIYRSADGTGKIIRNRAQFGDTEVGAYVDCPVSVEKHNGKWIYRAAIPWTELFGASRSVSDGYKVRLGVLLNDNDGDGRKYVEFCEGIASSSRPNTFINVTLEAKR